MKGMIPIQERISERVKIAKGGEREILLKLAKDVEDLISLGRGDPDLDTPKHIIEAGIEAMRSGYTHYTHWAGMLALRELIAEKLKRDNNLTYDPEREIIVTTGGQQAVMATMMALLNPGDEVIMGDPHYTSYGEVVKLSGGELVLIPTYEEDDFIIQPKNIESNITDKTKILVIVSPNNPTGTLIPRDVLKKVAQIAIEKDLLVISDEIYEQVVFDDNKHFSIGSLPGMKERTIIINGFSKAYSMTGWRIGYMAAPAGLVEKMESLMHSMTISVAGFTQKAAIAALKNGNDCVKETIKIYDERRRALMKAFDNIGLKYSYPKSGLYMWVNIKPTGMTSFEFTKELLLKGKVQVFPGTVYGGGEGYIRVSLLASTERLKEAARRIEETVKKII